MVVTIAYRDKPGEVLYSFLKVGDSVCIGRDKRQCKIALGVNAQGVSRVHLKLELLSNGHLLARDTSTYGTGYDGGPFVVEKEKELKPSMVLQTNSRKRLTPCKAAVVVEEEYVTEKRRATNSIVEKLAPGMNESERESARNTEMQGILDAHTSSGLSTDKAWIEEQDRKLAAKLGKEMKEKMDSVKLAYYRRIADFLPSDSEDDEEIGQNKSKVSMFTMADSSRNVDSTTRVSLQYDSSNKSTCDMVQDTYFPTADSNISNEADGLFKGLTSVKIVPENLANDSILSGAKENEILDIDIKKLSKPLLSSTQLTYFQDKLTKNVNEVSTIEKNNTPISHAEQFSKFSESQNVAEKFCSHPFKTVLKEKDPIPPKVISRQKTIATGLTSWLGMNTAKKRSNHFENQSNMDELVVASKRVKMEVVEDENKEQESGKNESLIESRTECEVNVGEKDRILGMNIEVLRVKLRKAVQYEDLEKPVLAKNRTPSYLTGHLQESNCKRFKKAAQGSHGGCGLLHSAMTRIVGVADLIDFREIA